MIGFRALAPLAFWECDCAMQTVSDSLAAQTELRIVGCGHCGELP